MSLRQKTLLIIGLTISTLSVILFFSANAILLGGFRSVENREMESSLSRAVNTINLETGSLAAFAEDWGAWDDNYLFIAGEPNDFLKKNVTVSTFLSQQFQLMAFFDVKGNLVYGTLFDPVTKLFTPLPDSIKNQLLTESELFPYASPDRTIRGLVTLPGVPLLVASRPIVDSEKKLPPRGIMIVGKFLTAPVLAQMSAVNHLSIQVQALPAPNLPVDFSLAVQNLSETHKTWIEPLDGQTIAGYTLITDLNGRPGLVLRVDSPRYSYLQGQKTVQYFSFMLIILGLLFGISNLFLLEKTVLKRLSSLSHQVAAVGENTSPSQRVQIEGNDELSLLAEDINKMLGSLATTQNELKESETATRVLLEGLPDFLLRLDRHGTILDFKTARDRFLATPPKLLPGNSITDAYPASLAEKFSTALEQAFVTKSTQLFEHEMLINNQTVNQEIRITPITDSEAIAILRDFTERRQLEKSLRFFNLRDSVTGLFNRTYWEEKLAAFSQQPGSVIGIILFEIDEMGLIRDSLGPDHSNTVLVATASALRSSLPLDAVIARIGAEKFAALIPGADESGLKIFVRKIRQKVELSAKTEAQFLFSLSIGFSHGIATESGIAEIFKSAKMQLHREHLSHSQASRNNLFLSLQTALETRDFVTHQHAARLWALGKALAAAAGLPAKSLTGLKLLAQFHDIGKVGVSDELIFKEGRLTTEEMKQMKLHVEIGHRIAQSIPDLFPISDLLLKHHEWWNGDGYPLGLQGEEIPLECRIFSIVDAFDAMTNDRPDRKALSVKEAAAELRRCAGSQFDPNLVVKFLAIIGEGDLA